MANTLTPYGAVLDTAGTTIDTGFAISTIVITETGGTSGGIVTVTDGTNVICKVGVSAGGSATIRLDGIRPDKLAYSTTGGTIVVSAIRRTH